MRVVSTPYYARILRMVGLEVELARPDPSELREVEADLLVVPWELIDRVSPGRARSVIPASAASFSEVVKTGLRAWVLAGGRDRDLRRFLDRVLDAWREEAPVSGSVRAEDRLVRELCWDLGVRVGAGRVVAPDYRGGELPTHGFEDPLEAVRERARALRGLLLR
ncbi:hypothetical protein [Methanopyrus sp.]